MTRKEKTYKFLGIANNVDPRTVSNRPIRLMRIKTFRSDTAEKIAKKRIEKLEKQTGCKWTLHSDPGKLSERQERKLRALRFLSRANDYILERRPIAFPCSLASELPPSNLVRLIPRHTKRLPRCPTRK